MNTMFTRIAVRDVLTLASVTLIVSVCVWLLFHDLNGLEDAWNYIAILITDVIGFARRIPVTDA